MLHLAKRFEAAVRSLVGDGPVKQRLDQAFTRYLDDLEPADLPEPIRAGFEELHAAMHRVTPIGKETGVKASVQKMSFAEAAAHAEAIVALYAELLRAIDRVEPLKIVHNEDKAPLYSTGRP